MSAAQTPSGIRVAAISWIVLILLGCFQSRALGQQVSLQTQTEYRFTERKLADGSLDSFGRISPYLLLTLRGPVWGGTNLYMDMGLTESNTGDAVTTVDQQNLQLNVTAQGTRMNLTATLNRNVNRISFADPKGGPRATLVTADNYALTGVLSYPSYPTLSLQYQKAIIRPDTGPAIEVSNRLFGANYDWKPFRFTADDSEQQAALSGQSVRTRTFGVNFSESATPTVRLSVDHYTTLSQLTAHSGVASTSSRVTRASVSALPTPFLVVDADLALVASTERGDQHPGQDFTGRDSSLYLRSEVLPGVQLDLSKHSSLTRSPFGRQTSDVLSGNLAAQLLPTTNLVATWAQSDSRDRISGAAGGQRGGELSLTSELSPETELFAGFESSRRWFGNARQNIASLHLEVRRQLNPTLSLGTGYSQYRQDYVRTAQQNASKTDALQLDATWLPSDLWALRLGLGLSRSTNGGRSFSLTPSLDARWEMDPATTIAVRYDLRRVQQDLQQDGILLSATTTTSAGLTGRLNHRFPDGSTLDLIYDYQKGAFGPFVWQKTLDIRYTKTF